MLSKHTFSKSITRLCVYFSFSNAISNAYTPKKWICSEVCALLCLKCIYRSIQSIRIKINFYYYYCKCCQRQSKPTTSKHILSWVFVFLDHFSNVNRIRCVPGTLRCAHIIWSHDNSFMSSIDIYCVSHKFLCDVHIFRALNHCHLSVMCHITHVIFGWYTYRMHTY